MYCMIAMSLRCRGAGRAEGTIVPARMLRWAYGGWMLALAVVVFAWSGWYPYCWALIGVTSAAATLIGPYLNQARRKGPWLLIACGILAFACGDAVFNALASMTHNPNPFPSSADWFYVTAFLVTAAGLISLTRAATAGSDRGSLLDAF